MKWLSKIAILSFLEFFGVLSQYSNQFYGETCFRQSDNASGTCEYFDKCEQIQIDLQNKDPVTTCLIGNPPIVCCIEKRRISERKCEEYKKLVDKQNCVTQDISDGFTLPGEYPHMVALGVQRVNKEEIAWIGSGTLISEKFVLTVASLFRGTPIPSIVRLGDQNVHKDDDGAEPQTFAIKTWIKHPDSMIKSKYNDIGLIEVDGIARFSKFVRPACLWQLGDLEQAKVVLTGWGTSELVGSFEPNQRKFTITTLHNNECRPYFTAASQYDQSLKDGIIGTQICAANIENGKLVGGKALCLGSSGSPIQVETKENSCKMFTIAGVSSFSVGCGLSNSPSIFTRVSSYLDWIESVVWPNERQ